MGFGEWLADRTGIHPTVIAKKVGEGATAVGHTVGSIASNPWVDGVIGATLGPGAAALAGGVGRLLAPGGNLGEAAKAGVVGYGAGKVGQGLRNVVGGAGSIGSRIGEAIPAIKAVGSGLPGSGGITGGAGGLDLGGLGGALTTGLAGIDAARQQQKARDTQDNAVQYATDSYDSRAPLRTAGIQGMLNPQAPPALQALRARANRGNPYGVPAISPVKAG